MISQHHMDFGAGINFDIEEKQINLGLNLIEQELMKFNDALNFSKMESLSDILKGNMPDFKALYDVHQDELVKELENIEQMASNKSQSNSDAASALAAH